MICAVVDVEWLTNPERDITDTVGQMIIISRTKIFRTQRRLSSIFIIIQEIP